MRIGNVCFLCPSRTLNQEAEYGDQERDIGLAAEAQGSEETSFPPKDGSERRQLPNADEGVIATVIELSCELLH
jgi:hypothetical protein